MRNKVFHIFKIPAVVLALSTGIFFSCRNTVEEKDGLSGIFQDTLKHLKSENITDFPVDPPPFTEGIFPCTGCHADMKPNPVRRVLVDFHDSISAIFNHDSENRWCLDCHDLNNRDSLKLASGKLLDFKESYKLCGQCHGEKYRDWKVGVHGKRTGFWNGKKEYLLCVNCHNPHSPRFRELKPDPAPVKQEDIDRKILLPVVTDSIK